MTETCISSAANAVLSPSAAAFLERVEERPELLERRTFAALAEDAVIAPFPLQAWPAFVDRAAVDSMARVTVELCRLVKEIPRRVFDGDAEEIAWFYGLPGPDPVRAMLAEPTGIEGALARGDFLWTERGLSCLEINLASHLGGWRAPLWAESYRRVPALSQFAAARGIALACRDTLELLFEHILAAAGRVPGGGLRVAVCVPPDLPAAEAERLEGLLDRRCREVAAVRGVRGSVLFCAPEELREGSGTVSVGGRPVGAVIEAHEGPTPAAVYRGFKSGGVQLYNGTVRQILSDKRNLALLSELSGSGLFSDRERALIERHVPWTRRLDRGTTTWRGQTLEIPRLAVAARTELVLKDARFATSGKGRGVFVGAETAEGTWRDQVARGLGEGGWVIQERVESLPFVFQHGERGCAPHAVVWGLFAFGSTYAGGFLSLAPRGTGVVNTHRGASSGVIFETGEGGQRGPARFGGRVS